MPRNSTPCGGEAEAVRLIADRETARRRRMRTPVVANGEPILARLSSARRLARLGMKQAEVCGAALMVIDYTFPSR
jgi:hypothetical protein